jgi:single-stranded-DNA-specific exonuclease
MKRVWDIRKVEPEKVESLSSSLQISPLLARLLLLRYVNSSAEGERFLRPTLSDLHKPELMRDMDKVVERLLQAMRDRDTICVWGDYDVDGITATSVLVLFLRSVGFSVDYHIPSRVGEGYGLNVEHLQRLAQAGKQLLITVDCGISDFNEIQSAVDAGMDVIVIDHHQVPEQLPPAVGVLNPHRNDCAFPDKDMAAVGVTFNLVIALRTALRSRGAFDHVEEPNLRELLDLVALGTVADIVPLLDENRTLTHFGLEELSSGRRPGVAALKEVAGLFGSAVTSSQLAFRLAPRINAIGRIDSAQKGVELLTTRSYSKALKVARELDQANTKRQDMEQRIFEEALAQAKKKTKAGRCNSLVLVSHRWHMGVIGIVASRLVEKYYLPTILISLGHDSGRGSARGVSGLHLYELLSQCEKHLVTFGGHKMAAGLSIETQAVEAFARAFEKAVDRCAAAKEPKTINVDALVQPKHWNQQSLKEIGQLAPHGSQNPEPVFWGRNLQVERARLVGNDPPQHIKLTMVDGKQTLDLIAFRMGDRLDEFKGFLDILYTPEFNTYNGLTKIQFRLLDARPAQ